MKKKAFTLIELIAVLVILAILALIVTPLVMNIIRKARISADKRSIDAYGRSVELAIASHLLDTGTFPTDLNSLTIEYTGDQVVCATANLNSDSSVYLAGCTVEGRSVDYTYGKEEAITYDSYSIGDEVKYNGIDYYVIKDSSSSEEIITLLKSEPLTVDEVNLYGGVGTINNHVNAYCVDDGNYPNPLGTSYNIENSGVGGIAYYESEGCYYKGRGVFESSDCKSSYKTSAIKYVVDAWKTDKAPLALDARLITRDEVETESIEVDGCNGCGQYFFTVDAAKYDWMYNSNYSYWTMTTTTDNDGDVWRVDRNGFITSGNNVSNNGLAVRPVITIKKSALSS